MPELAHPSRHRTHFLVSATLTSDSLAVNQALASTDVYIAGNMGYPTTVAPNDTGRYIRIQTDNNNYLSIGEVNVTGVADVAGEVVLANPFSIDRTPPAGNLTCSLAVNATNVTITWTGDKADAIGRVPHPNRRQHLICVVDLPGTSFTDTQQRRHLQLRNP
ncbi:MAG: hypothetical protein R2706_03570 [Acidimicrobiales bacterium]